MSKIEQELSNQLIRIIISESNVQVFLQKYNTLELFLSSPYVRYLYHFKNDISLKNVYDNVYSQLNVSLNNSQQMQVQTINPTEQVSNQGEKPKRKILSNRKISGFVDTLILAFITGSFIGMIILNIYSKIAQNF